MRIDRDRARAILSQCRIPLGSNFHSLDSGKVESLLEEARAYGYRPPKARNGSKARYWHSYLERAANRESGS